MLNDKAHVYFEVKINRKTSLFLWEAGQHTNRVNWSCILLQTESLLLK